MRIAAAQTAYVAGAGLAAAAARPGSSKFALASHGPGKTGAPRSAAPLATLDAILALQGGDEEAGQERRRRSARRGRDLLDALDDLKVALLSGEVSPAALRRVSDRLAGAKPSGDPGLDGVVAEIELRAQVEIAKLARR